MTKVCNICGDEKILDEFYVHKGCKDGRNPHCKSCRSEQVNARKDTDSFKEAERERKVIAEKQATKIFDKVCNTCNEEKPSNEFYVKVGSVDGRDRKCKKCRGKAMVIQRSSPETKARIKKWHKAHSAKPEIRKVINRGARVRYDTPEGKIKHAAKGKKWAQANPEKAALNSRKRIARKHALEGFHTYEELEEILIEQLGKCVYCKCSLMERYSVDHIIPITREGSTDYAYNLQLLCKPCNSSKKDKTHEEFIIYLKER
jgi:hypothetical protein